MSTKFNPADQATPASGNFDNSSIDRYFEFRIKRNTAIAILVSLLVHGIILFAYYPKKLIDTKSAASLPPQSISVHIAGIPARKTFIARKPAPRIPPTIALDKKVIAAPHQPVPPPIPAATDAPKDFMSFIKAKRQLAQDQEDYADRENANARTPSEDEQRDANIARNLKQQGTSGIFEIRRKTARTAQFSFKGWKNASSIPHVELIDVNAGADGNIDLAIVRKMIEIIRREYKGDFNWESQRLGRVIVLSARIEDNDGLEEFLQQEFFSAQGY